MLHLAHHIAFTATKQPCSLKEYTGGYVCVCNSTYCDSMDPVPTNIPSGEVKIFTSTEAGLRFHENSSNFQTAPNGRLYICASFRDSLEIVHSISRVAHTSQTVHVLRAGNITSTITPSIFSLMPL